MKTHSGFLSFQVDRRQISSAQMSNSGRMVTVGWSDGSAGQYPAVWLRDNCQCNQCFHQVQQRVRVTRWGDFLLFGLILLWTFLTMKLPTLLGQQYEKI
jgi:hypothetical protein